MIEKDAVLKKIKEQQKHLCTCGVCGRKRSAIEEELDLLYQSYYRELESHTSRQREDPCAGGNSSALGPGPFPGSVQLDSTGAIMGPDPLHPESSHHRKKPQRKLGDDFEDEDYEDEFDEDELEEEVDGVDSDVDQDHYHHHYHHQHANLSSHRPSGPGSSTDLFGSAVTVKGMCILASWSAQLAPPCALGQVPCPISFCQLTFY